MPASVDLARSLVEYDDALARDILVQIVRHFGGAVDGHEVPEAMRFLENLAPREWTSTTTTQWKADFAHHERVRAFGLELARLLDGLPG